MKKHITICLLLLTIVFSLNACGSSPSNSGSETGANRQTGDDSNNGSQPTGTVTIADSSLSTKIREALNLDESQAITEADMLSLSSLYAESSDIVNLDGLQYAKNLEDLNLYYNNISDLSPLAGLTGLKNLQLGANKISDIGSLSKLTGLSVLNVDNNEITDLSPLAELTQLVELSLSHNSVTQIDALADMKKLETLDISHNKIGNYSVLLDLPELTSVKMRNY